MLETKKLRTRFSTMHTIQPSLEVLSVCNKVCICHALISFKKDAALHMKLFLRPFPKVWKIMNKQTLKNMHEEHISGTWHF